MATRTTPGRGRTPRPEPAHLAQARERRRKINSTPSVLEIAAGNCERHARHLLALASFLRHVEACTMPDDVTILRIVAGGLEPEQLADLRAHLEARAQGGA